MEGIFIVAVIVLIFVGNRVARKKAESKITIATQEASELRQKVIVVSAETVPGKEIKQVAGHVIGTSKIEASRPEEAEAAEKEAMVDLMRNAVKMGANAVVGVKMQTSSHEQQGSKWMVSKTYYTGTAVIV